ncbi:MAG: nitroreductase family protein [Firmicutes bacterium]|nr:nitroreductase family protein [Bacillota bacterium]MBU4533182.1 nitroreductase family protein [Bacillota bacterium]MBV1726759.1 nitroreductase family protein [Desulforudis sp.]MBV1735621.1 nitroreductase family protein [Desulforudis sp.]
MLSDLVHRNRSYRRFSQSTKIEEATLRELVDLARHTASAANLQPLRYMLSSDAVRNALIFDCLTWAAYLKDWKGPVEGERPSAYIVILGDTTVSRSIDCDHGISAQTILLGAVERGLGGCMLAAIDRDRLRQTLRIPDRYQILLVIALGEPAETVVIDPVGDNRSIKYWRDHQGIHHVPKRSLDEIILGKPIASRIRTVSSLCQ